VIVAAADGGDEAVELEIGDICVVPRDSETVGCYSEGVTEVHAVALAWLSVELATVGVPADMVAAAQAFMCLVDLAGSQAGKYEVDAHGSEGIQVGDHNVQNNTFVAPMTQPSPGGGGQGGGPDGGGGGAGPEGGGRGGDGGSGMARITYRLVGEDEPHVAVLLPGLKIEGKESEVARLGFPPTPGLPTDT
jgi:hypothetical protein